MATTTPNFGWSVPTSTDLVKDGATAIETLGDSIDASLVDLKGGTTGQVLAKASNTDMDFSWVAQDDSNAIQNAIVDAKGDLIAATAADTPARLAVGANDTVLTADSSTATGLKWATPASSGGMTLLSTTTLSGASTTVSVASGYTDLYVLVYGVTNNTADNIMTMRTQNTGSVYRYTGVRKTASASAVSGGPDSSWNIGMNEYPLRTNANNIWAISINDYLNTSHYKTIQWFGSFVYPGPSQAEVFGGGVVLDNAAITDLVFANVGGTFSAGTVKLYGVK